MQRIAGRLAGFLAQVELEIGPLLAQPRQHRRQQERRDRRDHAHPQFAMERLALRPGDIGQLLALAQDPNSFVGDLSSKRREADDPAGAFDQSDAKQGFELAQVRPTASTG